MKIKTIILSAMACLFAFPLASCGNKPSFEVSLGYTDGTVAEEGVTIGRKYDTSLFYRNDLLLSKVADPYVLYVEEGENAGKLFLYGTSDSLGVAAIGVWQSYDGVNWDSAGVAFEPDTQSWSYSNLWAPEVLYDEESGLYYMTYSARNSNTIASGGPYYANTYIGMAYAESPYGPFIQYTGTDANGREIGPGDPIFDPALITAFNGVACEEGTYARYRFLDSSYFKDDDGQIWLYLSRGIDRYDVLDSAIDEDYAHLYATSEIWVVKMKDYATPDYSAVTQLTKFGYTTVDGTEKSDLDATRGSASNINEAPQMYKYDGKYYLTYSVGGTSSNLYSVVQAVGDSPEGPFRKLNQAEGGLLLGADMNWIQVAGSGHHCFTKIGDELFVFYHEGKDRYTVDETSRAIAYDRVGFAENADGLVVMTANGPTSYSLQALPAAISGYKNIASEATVTVTGLSEGSDAKYLTDGLIASHSYGVVKETVFDANTVVTVKLTFDDYRPVTALMLYNSIDFNKIFYQIAQIKFDVKTEGGAYGTAIVSNVYFPFDDSTTYSSQELVFAGSNLVLDFNEIAVKTITITFSAPRTEGYVAIGDIWVLGK